MNNDEIGRRIVEHEQGGEERAKYGKALLKELSAALTAEFGKWFSEDNLSLMRRFYLAYKDNPRISETLSRKSLLENDTNERSFYELEATGQGWSLRELKRQFNSGLYERLALSRDKV